jgi:tetratricopeptide (TPR) repeat protein
MPRISAITLLSPAMRVASCCVVLSTLVAVSGCRSSHIRPGFTRTISASRVVSADATSNESDESVAPEFDEPDSITTPVPQTPGTDGLSGARPYEDAEDGVPVVGAVSPLPELPTVEDLASPDAVGHAGPADQLPRAEVLAGIRKLGGRFETDQSGNVTAIDLSFTAVSLAHLQQLTQFAELTDLDLTGTSVSDDGITVICSLANLRSLKLKGTRVSDTGFRKLSVLSNLLLLDASRTAVTDEGLSLASDWPMLTYLSLNSTAVSDAGLRHLMALRNLKGLNLIRSHVTPAGVASLRAALPDCLVVSQGSEDAVPGAAQKQAIVPAVPVEQSSLDRPSAVTDVQLAQLIRLAVQQPQLAVHLSTVYSANGQWGEAARILSAAAEVDDSDPMLRFRLGEALAHSGHTGEALQHFQKTSGTAAANYNVGLIAYENMLRNCEQYFERSLQADPNMLQAQQRLNEVRRELALLRHMPLPPVQTTTSPAVVPVVIPGTGNHHVANSAASMPAVDSQPPTFDWSPPLDPPGGWQQTPGRLPASARQAGTGQRVPGF